MQLAPLFDEPQERLFRRAGVVRRTRVVHAARRSISRRLEACGGEAAVIQRQIDLFPSLTLERQAAANRRLILDVDDAVWLDTERAAGGHPLAFLKGSRRKLTWLARRADHVLAGNHLLAEWLSTYSGTVTVVPSTVEVDKFEPRAHQPAQTVMLGWIGSPPTARYLHQLAPVLAALSRAAPDFDFELHVVGGDMPEVTGLRVITHVWSETVEHAVLDRMHIGLMPLPDTPWTRHKCAYKALQYMAAGVPVVSDNVGISANVIGDGEGGFVVSDAGGWVRAIAQLAQEPDLRARMGAVGRRRVEDGFSTARWTPVIAAAIRGEPLPVD